MTLPQCRADLIYPPARLQYRKRITAALSVACASKLKEPIEWGTMRRVAGFVTPRGVAMEGLPNISPVFSSALEDSLNGAGGYFNSSTNGTALRVALGSIVAQNGTVDVIDLTTEPWGTDLSTDANSPWTREFESAECLYLILASTELYGERALDQFSSRMIANVDGDAVPEMVDPWGVPYEFIRDAAGFGFSFVNPPPAVGALPDNPHPSGSDSNDFLRTDLRYLDDDPAVPTTLVNNPYRMTPIIVSAGSDREFGIRRSFNLEGSFTDGLAGISPRHSISVIRYQTPPGASVVPQPFLGGSYQFPDPYLGVNPIGDPGASSDGSAFIASPAAVSAATYDAWNAGVGLGARIYNGSRPVAAAADDIFSVGGPQ
jgi:hypothetical protein